MKDQEKGLVVGISGASGVIYGIRFLEILARLEIPSYLILTEAGMKNIEIETNYSVKQVEAFATKFYSNHDLEVPLSSGSFLTRGMVVIPCSIKSLSAIAHCYCENLLARAADVTLKEQRKLVLVVRETPFHLGHLRIMVRASEQGAVILPPVPAFYHKPQSIMDLVDHTIGKILDLFEIKHNLFQRWAGSDRCVLEIIPEEKI